MPPDPRDAAARELPDALLAVENADDRVRSVCRKINRLLSIDFAIDTFRIGDLDGLRNRLAAVHKDYLRKRAQADRLSDLIV